MILFPAIDLYGGRVVRLTQGNFDQKTHYEENALTVARRYLDAGFTHLHIVDLEGSRKGSPCHLRELEAITDLGLWTQYGGGIRTHQSLRNCLDTGVHRVMIGSMLFEDQQMPRKLYDLYGTALLPSVDVKNDTVVHSGWLKSSGLSPQECLRQMSTAGFSSFLMTAVQQDGTLQGPDLELYRPLAAHYSIVAAGGISSIQDIRALHELGVQAAVIGKAFYEIRFPLQQLLEEFPQCRIIN